MSDQAPNTTPDLPLRNESTSSEVVATSEALRHYLQAATSNNTRKTYRSAIRQFEKWGGRLPSDRDTLVRYILARVQALNPRTLDLHLTAISQWHRYQGMVDPTTDPLVRKTMEGVRRTHGQPKRKAKPLRLEHIAQLLQYLQKQPDCLKTRRNRALILLGFFGAFRRSELVAIQVADLTWEPEGVIVKLPRSKTDQEGAGMARALPYGTPACCPVATLKIWLETTNISDGPVFRSVNRWDQVQAAGLHPGSVNSLLKGLGEACGFDFVPDLSSHSFRRGLSTTSAREGVDFKLIKQQGGWRSDATVWEYIEEGLQFDSNATNILLQKMDKLME